MVSCQASVVPVGYADGMPYLKAESLQPVSCCFAVFFQSVDSQGISPSQKMTGTYGIHFLPGDYLGVVWKLQRDMPWRCLIRQDHQQLPNHQSRPLGHR
jgi:hypothetical protein